MLNYGNKVKKDIEDIEELRSSLLEESDRGLILVGGALLEDKLKDLLHSHFVFERNSFSWISEATKVQKDTVKSLFSFDGGPLGTFVSKISLSFSVGLLEEYEFQNLERFGKVRNKFAHRIEASNLKSPQVVDLVNNFTGSKKSDRTMVADRVAKLAYQIIIRTRFLDNDGLNADAKRDYLEFAKEDPFKLKKRS